MGTRRLEAVRGTPPASGAERRDAGASGTARSPPVGGHRARSAADSLVTWSERWKWGIATAVLVLVGCAVALRLPEPGAPTVVTVPAGPRPPSPTAPGPRLDHPRHAALGLGCGDCHEIGESHPGYPEADTCLDCHADLEDDAQTPPEERVGTVFFLPDGRPRWTKAVLDYDPAIVFDHRTHASVECAECHGAVDEVPRRRALLQEMSACVACHEERGAAGACAACHPTIRDDVAPADHGAGWEIGHGRAVRGAEARGEDADCRYCHRDPGWCNDCHLGRQPSSHACGWETAHGARVLAAGGPGLARCTFCHAEQSFCDGCHMSTMPTSHRHLWRERHGLFWRAQAVDCRIGCTFCHHEPAFCEDCHRDVEPRDHTNLFRTRTHGLAAAVDRTRCMVCHATDFCVRCHQDCAPRSHRGPWARGRSLHCVQCHFPIGSNPSCRACHFENPTHDAAPLLPAGHEVAWKCRACHIPGEGLRHVDPGLNCLLCHQP